MESEFLVGVVIVLTLWVFVILVAIVPWFGVTIIPYMVIFTFIGAVAILLIIWAYKSDSLEGLGWETLVILLLVMAAVLIGLFVLWFFIRKKLKKFDKKVEKMKVCDEIKEKKEGHYQEIGSSDDNRPKGYRLPPPSKYSPQLGEPRGMVPIPSLNQANEGQGNVFRMSPAPSASMSPAPSASMSLAPSASMSLAPSASLSEPFSGDSEGGCPAGNGFCNLNQ